MKLVTYDRGGLRRLGALLGEAVIDLPDLVGHPAFPTTMEGLVARNGGTVLEAAEAALAGPERHDYQVPGARLLVPLLPGSLRRFDAFEAHAKAAAARRDEGLPDGWGETPVWSVGNHRTLLGPDDDLVWPSITQELDLEAGVAAVVGRFGRGLSATEAARAVFGYTLVNDWVARDVERGELAARRGPGASRDFATSLGPCIVTADELDPRMLAVEVVVDGEAWGEGWVRDARWTFPELVAEVSRGEDVLPGDLVLGGTFPGGCGADVGRVLTPGSGVEILADGLGALRNRIVAQP